MIPPDQPGRVGVGAAAEHRETPRLLQLYMVHHGQTEWSLSGRHAGLSEIPLTREGEEQARSLRDCVAGIGFSGVFSSPRLRAQRTCVLAGLGGTMQIDPDLAEWNYGDYEGLLTPEIRMRRPDWNLFRYGCPGGEAPGEVAARADRLIMHLLARGGTLIVFTHAQFGAVLAARWLGLAANAGRHFSLAPSSLSILGHTPDRPTQRVIALWNALAGPLRPWPPAMR